MTRGPELFIIGSSRSGSTSLANYLNGHPLVQLPAIKEPNYYSVYHDRGASWYASLFGPVASGTVRLDASTTYSYPQFPGTLERLARDAPSAQYVYIVREPVERAFSQFVHESLYLQGRRSDRFENYAERSSHYVAPSRYRLTLEALSAVATADRVLVVPFETVVSDPGQVARIVLSRLGLDPTQVVVVEDDTHQNQRVVMRSRMFGRAFNAVRDSRAYAALRARLGDSAVRRIRGLMTSEADIPSLTMSLAELDGTGLEELRFVFEESRSAVAEVLADQDLRLGLRWSEAVTWIKAGGQPEWLAADES